MADENKPQVSSRLIVKNLPKSITQERLKEIFKDYDVTDIKLIHKSNGVFRGFAFIGLRDHKNAKELYETLNGTYIDTSKLVIDYAFPVGKFVSLNHNKDPINESKNERKDSENILEMPERDRNEFEEFLRLHNVNPASVTIKYVKSDEKNYSKEYEDINNLEAIKEAENNEELVDSARLFVRNLPFTCNETDIEEFFKPYGTVSEVHLPRDKLGRLKGFGYVTFESAACAVDALNKCDGSAFQGRPIHILPAKSLPKVELPDSLSFKMKKRIEQRLDQRIDRPEWNTLFLGHKVVADHLTKNCHITKEKLLKSDICSATPAVRLAIGETDIVAETKKFLTDHGVCVDSFRNNNIKSKDTLLAKNLPVGTTHEDLKEFIADRLNSEGVDSLNPTIIIPPFGITALLGFSNETDAKKAFKFKNSPFYLEWAPLGSFSHKNTTNQSQTPTQSNSVVYVKNLNFETTELSLQEKFKHLGSVVKVSIAKSKTKDKKDLSSLGFGFIEFDDPKIAKEAVKTMQHTLLDGHRLVLKLSNKKPMPLQIPKKQTSMTQHDETLIIVKNVPFEADLSEIQQLFSAYGGLKRVRMPKKLHENKDRHRGFAFVEFASKEEAHNAFESLKFSTHLYGRRLVLEWANRSNSLESLRRRAQAASITTNPSKRKAKFEFSCSEEQECL